MGRFPLGDLSKDRLTAPKTRSTFSHPLWVRASPVRLISCISHQGKSLWILIEVTQGWGRVFICKCKIVLELTGGWWLTHSRCVRENPDGMGWGGYYYIPEPLPASFLLPVVLHLSSHRHKVTPEVPPKERGDCEDWSSLLPWRKDLENCSLESWGLSVLIWLCPPPLKPTGGCIWNWLCIDFWDPKHDSLSCCAW